MSEVLQSACLSVCLSPRISRKPHVKVSRNFPHILPMAVARSSSDGSAVRYVLPVWWMTSCFSHNVAQWLGGSDHRRTTRHPLPERHRLARSSWHSKRVVWVARRAALLRDGDEVCRLRLPYSVGRVSDTSYIVLLLESAEYLVLHIFVGEVTLGHFVRATRRIVNSKVYRVDGSYPQQNSIHSRIQVMMRTINTRSRVNGIMFSTQLPPMDTQSYSPLCSSITPALFHSRLKTYLFHKSYPP